MAKKSNNFIVPEHLQHEYKMTIQRANRRIKSNLKYLNTNRISNSHTRRSLVGSFDDGLMWSSRSMPFSRSIKGRYIWNPDTEMNEFREFTSERDFKQYLNYVNKWGQQTKKGERFDAHPQQVKENYKSAIIKALNQVKDHYSITLPNGQIPKEIIDQLDKLSLEQMTNFFANGDPSEDVEISQFNSDDFIDVTDAEGFIDTVTARLGQLRKFY